MITSLTINNYALIDSLNISFAKGFSVLTGETGAGKSIILGALSLILGQRADAKSIKTGHNKCVIEGNFDLSNYKLEPFFIANDLEYDASHCIIRREIYASGKSRAFINDTPVSLTQLKQLGGSLIDIHSQHQNLLISEDAFQLRVIDTLADNSQVLAGYLHEFSIYKQLNTELKLFIERSSRGKEESDYIRFQLKQLQDANLKVGEQEELEAELDTITHSEDIKSGLYQISNMLDGNEGSLLPLLKDVVSKSNNLRKIYPQIEDIADRLNSDYIDLKDIAGETDSMQDAVSFDPERQQWIQERLDLIYQLQQKHHTDTIGGLVELQDSLALRLGSIDNSDEKIASLKKDIERQLAKLTDIAQLLTQKRKQVSDRFINGLVEKLRLLGMPNVRFDVSITPKNGFDETGADNVKFLFSANKNQTLMPVADIASGGEISRVMLVIKSLIANAVSLPTIIFDEIDTGVSGEIADKMGLIMYEMSKYMQVLSITHLPQVASKGEAHYKVYKQDDEYTTTTNIISLSQEERIKEIARMLSGAKLTSQAIDNAKVLMSKVRKSD